MEDLDVINEEQEHNGGYTPSEDSSCTEIPQPSNDFIPLDESTATATVDVTETVAAELGISDQDVDDVLNKSVVQEAEHNNEDNTNEETTLGRKCCPTRHGCQGATDCDYAYGSYPF